MQLVRIAFTCAMMEAIEKSLGEPVSVVTLLPTAGPNFLVRTLKGVDPRRLLEIVRADLNRCGAKTADGWLILALHGEFDPVSRLYRLHFHAVAVGEMVKVVDKLRKLRKYQSRRQDLEKLRTAVDKPIKVSRKPITNLPTTLAYVCAIVLACPFDHGIRRWIFAEAAEETADTVTAAHGGPSYGWISGS